MRHEAKPEAIRERLHLGHWNHLASRTAQHHHMRVVDHHAFRGAIHITHRIGEKHLAVEPLKGGRDLKGKIGPSLPADQSPSVKE